MKFKDLLLAIPSVGGTSYSLATLNTAISVVAGISTIVYTGLLIYWGIEKRRREREK